MVVGPFRRGFSSICCRSFPLAVRRKMFRFMLFKPGWWILHILAIAFFFWLGHVIQVLTIFCGKLISLQMTTNPLIKKLVSRWYSEGGYREFLIIAFPLILSTGMWSIEQFIDRMFLSWYSPATIAAAMPAGMLNFAFMSFFPVWSAMSGLSSRSITVRGKTRWSVLPSGRGYIYRLLAE